MITAERLRELVHYCPETGEFTWITVTSNTIKIGDIAGSLRKDGYFRIGIDKKLYFAHRLAWLYVYGNSPLGYIDHIDGDRSNNRINNLRDADRFTNNQNIKCAQANNKSTGFLGVTRHGSKFKAQITINRNHIHLGLFDNPHDAHEAYLSAKRLNHKGCTI
jgi:hypothetical protein